jgi:hypothetical protein
MDSTSLLNQGNINNGIESVYAEINNEVAKLEQEDIYMQVDQVESTDYNLDQDCYMWMLQKVMSSIPDIIIDPEYRKESSSDGESINDYTNNATFKYFNSFD